MHTWGEGVEVVKASGFSFSSASSLVRDRLVEEGRDKLLPIASDYTQHDDAVLQGKITPFYLQYIYMLAPSKQALRYLIKRMLAVSEEKGCLC